MVEAERNLGQSDFSMAETRLASRLRARLFEPAPALTRNPRSEPCEVGERTTKSPRATFLSRRSSSDPLSSSHYTLARHAQSTRTSTATRPACHFGSGLRPLLLQLVDSRSRGCRLASRPYGTPSSCLRVWRGWRKLTRLPFGKDRGGKANEAVLEDGRTRSETARYPPSSLSCNSQLYPRLMVNTTQATTRSCSTSGHSRRPAVPR